MAATQKTPPTGPTRGKGWLHLQRLSDVDENVPRDRESRA